MKAVTNDIVSSGAGFFGESMGLLSRIVVILVFKICLDVATVLVSAEALGKYSIDLQYDVTTIFTGYAAALFLAVCLPPWRGQLDALFIWIIVLFMGIPIIIPYQWGGASVEWMLVNTLFLGALGAQSRVGLLRVGPFRFMGGWWFLGIFFGAVTAYSILSSVLTVGLTPTFDFSLVYEIRDRFIEQKIPFATYAYKWTAFIVVPFLFMFGRIRRSLSISLIAIVFSLILFFATGHKMYLLIPGFVYAVDWCFRRKNTISWFVLSLSALVIVGTVTFYSLGDVRINATFSNRLYVLPAKISYEYHEFFTTHPKVMLSHSVLGTWFDYPYAASPPSLISDRYYANPEGSPNTGMLADAYMNFGYAGVVMLLFLVSFLLRLVRWIAERRDKRLVLSLVVIPIFTWVNSGFLTSFMTSGMALGLLGAFFLPLSRGRQYRHLLTTACTGGMRAPPGLPVARTAGVD